MTTRYLDLGPSKYGLNSLNDERFVTKRRATSDFGPTWHVPYDAFVLRIYTPSGTILVVVLAATGSAKKKSLGAEYCLFFLHLPLSSCDARKKGSGRNRTNDLTPMRWCASQLALKWLLITKHPSSYLLGGRGGKITPN
jgi:hypothetical protein